MSKINVTIWNEFRHEKENADIAKIYPDGIHGALAQNLASADLNIRIASLDEPENGLPEDVVNTTDVLICGGGHCAHGEVSDAVVARVLKRVQEGHGVDRAALRALFQNIQGGHRVQLFA